MSSPAEADRVAMIVAFSFGYRTTGDRTVPGPINHLLAACAREAVTMTGAPLYAQWEIADLLTSTIDPIRRITPHRNADGSTEYLSTVGVADAVLSSTENRPPGTITVIAHHDHADRCIRAFTDQGVAAARLAGLKLPESYDPYSAQPWTRTRDLYLRHEASFSH